MICGIKRRACDGLAKGDPTVQQYATHLTDQGCRVVDHAPTCPVQGLHILLGDAFPGHEAHTGLAYSDGNGFGRSFFCRLPKGLTCCGAMILTS